MVRPRRRGADAALAEWFSTRGWKPAPFQREAWRRYLAGESGLLVTPTGSGKTLAALGGPLLQALALGDQPATTRRGVAAPPRLRVLWITPLRALAVDTVRALREPIAALGVPWTVALRTGDASARDKRLARHGLSDVLVITPESFALMLSYADAAHLLAGLRGVVVDEWHELLGNKRGVLLQLCLARLRGIVPQAPIWGLSATLGNLQQARDVLLPYAPGAAIVSSPRRRRMTLQTLLPGQGERFPWAGHLGLSQLQRVAAVLQQARSSLLFTNTRSQAELWHRALQSVWLDDPATLALHHGSLDASLRAAAEAGLRDGSVRCVVATSSLDLGVDFPAVDQVLQVGSPKGMARLWQRGGRARHRPGAAGKVICVPTLALELAEYAAARVALAHGRVESRPPPRLSLDVLAQHCVTLALGGGFEPARLLAEVRGTHAFAALGDEPWQAVLDFIVRGGAALEHYPDYRRVVRDADGVYRVHDRRVAFRHRLSIGTITSDGSVQVRFMKGGQLGSVEEAFIGKLRPHERFQFAGKTLELVQLRDMSAYVRIARSGTGRVPRWQGGSMPLSSELAAEVEAILQMPADSAEMRALQPLLELQARLSALPGPGLLLVESLQTRQGWHLFVYPFAGRAVHEGLAALMALRWGRERPNTFSWAVNDYGLVLTAQAEAWPEAALLQRLLSPQALLEDLMHSLNIAELARRQFRGIARVAGLLPPSLPGRAARSLRQLQASSSLLFEVLRQHDPGHVLLAQAEREVWEAQLEVQRLREVLQRCRTRRLVLKRPRSLSPLAFPLWADAIRGQLSTEDWRTRVARVAQQLEKRHARHV
ncbi:ligase-associated DNA damage response DEXH box helicase [Stenotrophomonas sp. YIM B06876]|uniref:ligase-associated DNA damage response DEXH box helicase n=1 Tax=Stenotrophomonas sp. YIM B06876 TaxID=3060211 RepID=UPI00273857EF|nr:ligase-associated DNA damage response DEXH box helicase [Stenotrophomonas sp. YIM B06876]